MDLIIHQVKRELRAMSLLHIRTPISLISFNKWIQILLLKQLYPSLTQEEVDYKVNHLRNRIRLVYSLLLFRDQAEQISMLLKRQRIILRWCGIWVYLWIKTLIKMKIKNPFQAKKILMYLWIRINKEVLKIILIPNLLNLIVLIMV